MVISWTSKYPEHILILSIFSRPNSIRVLPPITDDGNLLMRWKSKPQPKRILLILH